MPSYHTHSALAEQVYPMIEKHTNVSKEAFKTFAIGPDALISTDNPTFKNLHKQDVKDYYEALLKAYKDNKLLDNPEAMAFLYGQLCHFMLDVSTHPLIYYLTEKYPKEYKIGPHGIVEMWIDGYYKEKFSDDAVFYYKKTGIKDKDAKKVIDEVTKSIYGASNASKNYSNGIKVLAAYDSLARNNLLGFVPLVEKVLGPITFKNGLKYVEPFLNLDHAIWVDPETGALSTESFDDLFNKAKTMTEEIIHDCNEYLYHDKPLSNYYIENNISYNTGINCELGQSFEFCKTYPSMGEDTKPKALIDDGLVRTIITASPVAAAFIISAASGNNGFDPINMLLSMAGVLGLSAYDLVNYLNNNTNSFGGTTKGRK